MMIVQDATPFALDSQQESHIASAGAEYHESVAYDNLAQPSREHFDRATRTIKAREAQQFKFSQMDGADVWHERLRLGNYIAPGEPSEKAQRAVDAIREKHPAPFSYGARCGIFCLTHDAELFRHWTAGERYAFFAGYSFGRNERLRATISRAEVA